jgi:RND family efflux transporter MFP subunit
MSIPEDKKIVIRLPRIEWSWFLSLRFGAILAVALFATVFGYWYKAVRPYLWISGAHIEAFSTVLSSDMAGRIIDMGPQEGDLVRMGQVLLSLDRDQILAKQIQARHSLHSLNERIDFEKDQIEKVLDDYLIATSEFELGLGTQDKVKKQLALMEEAQEKSEAATSQLAAAQSVLSDLDLQIKKMTLTAPFSGVVLKRSKNPGAVVSFGEPLYVLCDPDRLWIEAEVPEKELGHILIGAPVRIQLSAYPKEELTGKVSWIGPSTVSKSTQLPFSGKGETIPVKISIEKPGFPLKPGLSAKVGLRVH